MSLDDENPLSELFTYSKDNLFSYELGEKCITERRSSLGNFPQDPISLEAYAKYIETEVLPFVVNVNNKRFVGHMTSCIPTFFQDLSKTIVALNQNVVKTETSQILTFVERKCLEYLHQKIYKNDDAFYKNISQNANKMLGIMTSNGSLSNTTAMWIARNSALNTATTSCADDGILACLQAKKCHRAVIVCSSLAHYSVKKIASLIGIGKNNIVQIPVDSDGRMRIEDLRIHLQKCLAENTCVLAVWGIAGTTELGSIDPLDEIATITSKYNIHFHVDAAWGGILALSKYAHLLSGIEKADSVTICGHKQFYLPQGISLILTRSSQKMDLIATEAKYQARINSFDLGRWSVEGSRPANCLFLHAAISCIGAKGYDRLLQHSFSLTRYFTQCIEKSQDFELVHHPQMNIVTYRYIPREMRGNKHHNDEQHQKINHINTLIQKHQRQRGNSFVSRTTIKLPRYQERATAVFRTVLINPYTQESDLDFVLEEQRQIAASLL